MTERTPISPDLALGTRTGLPDALRVLLERHPRAEWEGHPNFSALTRFWLQRHLMFRDLHKHLVTQTERFIDDRSDARGFGHGMQRVAGHFIGELHGHHGVEDMHYFPLLRGLDPAIAPAFDLLDADHHVLEPQLQSLTESANALLRAIAGARDPRLEAETFHAAVGGFGRFLDRHLTDEEEIVVPVILEHAPAGLD